MSRLRLALLILFTAALHLRAQSSSQQKFKLSGAVINSLTNEPIRNALVEINGIDRRIANTSSDGHFEADGLSPSVVFITARKPGFAPASGQQLRFTAALDSLVLKLAPLSKISGRVTDREGEPVDGVQIRCFHEAIEMGRKHWQQTSGATTDETGHFTVENLFPGSYLIQTGTYHLYRTPIQKSEASRYIYPPTYYPNASARDMAQRVEIAPGQEARVDMELHSVRAVHVQVATVPPSQNILGSIQIDDLDNANEGFPADASGLINFRAVPPGPSKIIARNYPGRARGGAFEAEDAVYGEVQLDVGTTDIENLTLPVSKLADIALDSGAPNQQFFAQLISKSGITFGSSAENDGVKFHAIPPGSYRFVALSGGSGCITSITSGSQDLMRQDLVIAPGSTLPPIHITQSDQCAAITVNLDTKTSATLLVTSALSSFQPRQNQITNGTASLGALTPGDYQVYAFDDLSDIEYANPEAMRTFKSQTVTLEPGETKSIQLELNERRK